ncbi:MAG: sigma-70 family RNA polymerase sigma factor [Reichenbachiella sp.]|uniref:RNA polymerase sigma factor n=1 Tax=Reichenbachiella sp. TaxID=2184521 RepID=UPI0032968032
MSDNQIIEELKIGNHEILRHVYEHLTSVESFVLNNSGTIHDAHDIFQEALIIFHRNVLRDEFQLTSTIRTYINAISRKMWLKKIRDKKMLMVNLDQLESHYSIEAFEFELAEVQSPELHEILIALLNNMGETCKEILQLFYFKKMGLESIKKKLGYATSQVVRQQKYRCLQKMRKSISSDLLKSQNETR